MIRGLLVKEWKDHGFSVAIIVLLLLFNHQSNEFFTDEVKTR